MLCREKDPKDANYRALEENRERLQDARLADGSKPEVVDLPMPAPLVFDGRRLPASYANFYVANAAVLVPTFNDPNDRLALGILAEHFKGRPVVGIHAVELVWGLGTLHCLTQQQPAVEIQRRRPLDPARLPLTEYELGRHGAFQAHHASSRSHPRGDAHVRFRCPDGRRHVVSDARRGPAAEPGPLGVLQGGVPTGQATQGEIALSLTEAIERGLRYNLGAILGGAAVAGAEGARKEALADLLPQLRAGVVESRQIINLAAYGFTGPGIPQLVGPFNLFDARAYLHQTILDLRALNRSRASVDTLEAARQDEHGARDLVVLVCGQAYLQAIAGESRIAAARAQLDTAEALLAVARDRKAAGLGAGIEVLRAQVQEQSLRQRLIVAEQDAAKEKLALARAIGLPLGQRFRLSDPMPTTPRHPAERRRGASIGRGPTGPISRPRRPGSRRRRRCARRRRARGCPPSR